MVVAKRCMAVVAIIGFAALCAVASAEATREGDKLMVRTKRQQCVCVVVSTANNQLQCSCDNTDQSTTSPGSPSGPYVPPTNPTTSATFAPISQQTFATPAPTFTNPPVGQGVGSGVGTGTTVPIFQDGTGSGSSSNNPCTCVQIVISQGSNSQYSCSCDDGASPTALDQGVGQNFLSSALNQADYIGNSIVGQAGQSPQYNPTPATAVPGIVTPLQQQQQVQNNQQFQPASQNQNFLSNALDQSNYLNAGAFNAPTPNNNNAFNTPASNNNNFAPITTLSTVLPPTQFGNQNTQTQQTAPIQSQQSNQQQFDSQYDAEPATTTCITITIPNSGNAQTSVNYSPSGNCLCGQNYVQCAENMCCHKRYRSLKKEEDSAMDIIVDVLRNIKERLDHRA
uniref:EB domain-containing protein n=1 Tax=Panagrellus redivivus TaxID=6233 RepID=A0A7E4W887_PANRE